MIDILPVRLGHCRHELTNGVRNNSELARLNSKKSRTGYGEHSEKLLRGVMEKKSNVLVPKVSN